MTNTETATVTTLRIAAVESCDVLRIALRAHYGTDAEAMRYTRGLPEHLDALRRASLAASAAYFAELRGAR